MGILKISSQWVPEGDGVMVRRLMPTVALRHFDPFVLWDHFDIESGGFPPHPHRGFEGITWLLKGTMQHQDNLGNCGTVSAGGAQRFTAGQGIVHSEMPLGRTEGIQLWVNLPKRLKTITPDYQQVPNIPITQDGNIEIRHIVGHDAGIHVHTPMDYRDIRFTQSDELSLRLNEDWRAICYVIRGVADLNGQTLNAGDAGLIENTLSITIRAAADTHLMWCAGLPHHEPIRQWGPFVD
ncbi:MAG: pirin family protein [Gammaproteobacteria bacterium]|nr:MAG: pirin family protein [Gammaproteobacteria bacterium]